MCVKLKHKAYSKKIITCNNNFSLRKCDSVIIKLDRKNKK